MECPVCLNYWEENEYTPLLLNCGHTLCVQCISSLIGGNILTCPSCYNQHVFEIPRRVDEDEGGYKRRCLESMTRNMTLLALIASRPSLATPGPKKPQSGRKYLKGQRCPEHNELVVCFTEKPFSYLCLQCMDEVKHMNLQIRPVPEVVEHLETTLVSVCNSCTRKLQGLQTTKNELQANSLESLDSLKARLNLHFGGMQGFLKKTCGDLQDYIAGRIENVLQGYSAKLETVYTLQAELEDEQARLERLLRMAPPDLASKYMESDIILAKAVVPLPEIETSAETFKVRVRSAAHDEFAELAKKSYSFNCETREGWACKACGETRSDHDCMCKACQIFRPLETYPNLLTSPGKATAKEIGELARRRQMELQMISELDTGEDLALWYLINTEWISQWKSFVFNKPSATAEQNSPNKAVGTLPPGPISNHRLFTDPQNPTTLKPQLKVVTNYRGVNERVWAAYFKIYGGGPVISRRKLNIYDEGSAPRSSSNLL